MKGHTDMKVEIVILMMHYESNVEANSSTILEISLHEKIARPNFPMEKQNSIEISMFFSDFLIICKSVTLIKVFFELSEKHFGLKCHCDFLPATLKLERAF